MKILAVILLLVSSASAQITFNNTNQQTTIGTATGDWKPVCVVGSCSGGTPGGTGTPSATSQTFGVTSPALDGKSMELSMTANSNSTNALWSFLAGSCDSCTNVTSSFHVYLPSNFNLASSLEADSYIFDKTQLYYLMFGLQCNQANGYWQIANDVSSWVNTIAPCNLSYGVWHSISVTEDIAKGDVSCPGSLPELHWSTLTIDGTTYTLNQQICATALPSTYVSNSGHQFQVDIPTASTSSPVTETIYIDESNFAASLPSVGSGFQAGAFNVGP